MAITFLDTYQIDFASRDTKAKASLMVANLDFVMVVYAGRDVLDAFVVVLGPDASCLEVGHPPLGVRRFVVDHTCPYYDGFDEPKVNLLNIIKIYSNIKGYETHTHFVT